MALQPAGFVLLLAILCWTTGPTVSQNTAFNCTRGFHLMGTYCYSFMRDPVDFDTAVRICDGLGAELLEVRDFTESMAVGERVEDIFAPATGFWIKNGKEDGKEGFNPNTTLCNGFWQPNQPQAERASKNGQDDVAISAGYDGYWAVSSTVDLLPYVCRTPACPQGSFRCFNGACINWRYKCDGVYDCSDRSDEFDCSDCVKTFRSSTGAIETGPYEDNTNCQWIIEGAPGDVLKIEFTWLSVEQDIDFVNIYQGASTVQSSELLKSVTGTLPAGTSFVSYNNFIIIRLYSDLTVTNTGFNATWSPVPELRAGTMTVINVTDSYQMMSTSNVGLPDFYRSEWQLNAPEGQLLVVEITSTNFGDDDLISMSHMAAYMTMSESNRHVYISNSNKVTFIIQPKGKPNRYLQARVKTGCSIDITFAYLELKMLDMAPKVECVWTFRNSRGVGFDIHIPGLNFADGTNLKIGQGLPPFSPASVYEDVNGTTTISDMISLRLPTVVSVTFYSELTEPKSQANLSVWSDCPHFPDQSNMNIRLAANRSTSIDEQVWIVQCHEGSLFAQDEYHSNGGMMYLTCTKFGSWSDGSKSLTRYPTCQPIYCGVPPPIQNGLLANSSGNVTYNGKAEYNCFAGFMLRSSGIVTCLSTGSWSASPVCEAEECMSVPSVVNANFEYVTGDSNLPIGTIIRYNCIEGYELMGAKQIACEIGNTWSSSAPTCILKQCVLPAIVKGSFNLGPTINVNETTNASCISAYALNGSAEVTCNPDGQLSTIPTCIDMNECELMTHTCNNRQKCVNYPGGYQCLCKSGYNDTGCMRYIPNPYPDCSPDCGVFPCTYICMCNPGYTLYTQNGTSGFFLSPGESGLEQYNTYTINRTCVRRQCVSPMAPNNGFFINNQSPYHFQDTLAVGCDFGFILVGTSEVECDSSGSWSNFPTCQSQSCPQPPLGNELEVGRVPTNGTILAGNNITISCRIYPGSTEQVDKILYCVPDNATGMYSLQGDDPECQMISCLQPVLVSGQVDPNIASTIYGVSYEFSCDTANGYTINGMSEDGNTTVRCNATGRWTLGTLSCQGASCTDPGMLAGTIQIAPNGYSVGETVSYNCTRDGFTATPNSMLECVYSNSQAQWNGPAPTCQDFEPPMITCPPNQELNLYDTITYEMPTVSDNSGFTCVSLVRGPPSGVISITTDTEIELMVNDGSNNQTCTFNVTLKDRTAPFVQCINDQVEIDLRFKTSDTVNITDVNISALQPGTSLSLCPSGINTVRYQEGIPVRATAYKSNGLRMSCAYMITGKVSTCPELPDSLPNISYEPCSNGTCTIRCTSGYVFQDGNTMKDFQCTGIIWTPHQNEAYCVLPTNSQFTYAVSMVYQAGDSLFGVNNTCYTKHEENLKVWVESVTNACGDYRYTIQNPSTLSLGPTTFRVDFILDVTNSDGNITALEACAATLLNNRMQIFDPTDDPVVTGVDCKPPWNLKDTSTESVTSKNFTCNNNGVLMTIGGTKKCVPCAPGFYYNRTQEACVACGPGLYNSIVGADVCLPCPNVFGMAVTRTKTMTAITVDDCESVCPEGFISSTGYLADNCTACPQNTYWTSPTTCEPCPLAGSTKGIVAAQNISHCFDPCPAGQYSLTGYVPCSLCPANFYNDQTNSTSCTECLATEYTTSNGSTSQADCVDASGLCVSEFCNPNGEESATMCQILDHRPQCTCKDGYSGDKCDTACDSCQSNPCYNGASCQSGGLNFTCTCKREKQCNFIDNDRIEFRSTGADLTIIQSGTLESCQQNCLDDDSCVAFNYGVDGGVFCVLMSTLVFYESQFDTNEYTAKEKNCTFVDMFSGNQCEIDIINDCTINSCADVVFCQDLINGTKCVCPSGDAYTQPKCAISSNLCDPNPCKNGQCIQNGDVRHVCICEPGFTGVSCDTNINECTTEDICLWNGICNDEVAGYSCNCRESFSGKNCQERGDFCADVDCGEGGFCYQDFFEMKGLCACGKHFNMTSDSRCQQINYCDSSPCENNGNCMPSIGGYDCTCATGYHGTRCQYEIDFCTPSSCQNEGVCQPILNDFNCDCPIGFSGSRCETNDDDCPGNCSVNTQQCIDQINAFFCECNAGYKGQDCNETIQMCDDLPCLHGGNCSNLFNDFSCSCQIGWTGKRCESEHNYCATQDTCQNSGMCHNLADGTLCTCESGTTGSNCEIRGDDCALFGDFLCAHGTCRETSNSAVCDCSGETQSCDFVTDRTILYSLNTPDFVIPLYRATESECQQSCLETEECIAFIISDGFCNQYKTFATDPSRTQIYTTAKRKNCTTESDFLGKSCEIQRNPCDPNPCAHDGNIGTCIINGTGYTCDCSDLKNVVGAKCQFQKDGCTSRNCPSGIECREFLDEDDDVQSQCMCPADAILSGSSCKVLDRNFDLVFDESTAVPEVDEIVTSRRGLYLGTEQVFTITFWVASLEKPKDWFLGLTSSNHDLDSCSEPPLLHFTTDQVVFGNESIPLGINVTDDYTWHFIAFSVDANRNYQLVVDLTTVVAIATSQLLQTPVPQNETVFIHIGNGFFGYISQVNVWNTVLSVRDVYSIVGDPQSTPSSSSLLLGWTLYSDSLYVYMTNSSSARISRSVCDIPLTIATVTECPTLEFEDRVPPALSTECPESKTIETGFSQHQLSYRALGVLFGNIDTQANVQAFSLGAHDVAITASDEAGNIGVCMVRAYFTPNQCEDTAPQQSLVTPCSATSSKVQCPDGQALSISRSLYAPCGKLRSYNLENMLEKPDRIICGETKPMEETVVTSLVYTFALMCNFVTNSDIISKMDEKLVALGQNKWPGLCTGPVAGRCTNTEVVAECDPTANMNVNIQITILRMRLNQTSLQGVETTPRGVMELAIQNPSDLDISSLAGAQFQAASSSVESYADCGIGYKSFHGYCVQCGPGSYYDNSTKTCHICDFNTFSENGGSTECTPCPGGGITLQKGNKNQTACVVRCDAGNMLNLTTGSCEACPKNFYQNNTGMSFCMPCPAITGTEGPQSTSREDCQAYCAPGTELQGRQCVSCPRSYYRIGDLQDQCTACSNNMTTRSIESVSPTECDIPICQPGSFVNESKMPADCDLCDYGFYQNETSAFRCHRCPPSYTTENQGTNNQTGCIFECPLGQEEFPAFNKTCRLCPQGTYRGSSLGERFSNCTECDPVNTTSGAGMETVESCNVVACFPGSYLNSTENACYPCDYGEYQNEKWQMRCLPCNASYTTEEKNSSVASQCKFVCPPGQEEHPPDSKTCRACPQGTYRNDSLEQRFSQCTPCHINFTTDGQGKTSESECSVVSCVPGTYLNSTTNTCHECDFGKFQPRKWQHSCLPCNSSFTTENRGSKNSSQCKFLCPAGEEVHPPNSFSCRPCPQGTYRGHSLGERFLMCTPCNINFTTNGTRSRSAENCSVAACNPGSQLHIPTNTCHLCPFGHYQPMKWQDSCLPCNTNFTTRNPGSVNASDCEFYCPAGQERYPISSETCRPCAQGTYRNDHRNMTFTECVPCSGEFTTDGGGKSSAADCNVAACQAGQYLNTTQNVCYPCDYGTYQPMMWQHSCLPCQSNYTTENQSSINPSSCRFYCAAGYEELSAENCSPCQRGYYRHLNLSTRFTDCSRCESPYTTESTGATSASQCSIRVCPTLGMFRNASTNLCESCPVGSYQDEMLQDSCKPCQDNKTTRGEGSMSQSDCLFVCVPGYEADNSGAACQPCQRGFYKNASMVFSNCIACQESKTTIGMAADDSSLCNIAKCNAGNKLSQDGSVCMECPVDTYQPDEQPLPTTECLPCSNTTGTMQPASVSTNDCTLFCDPGYGRGILQSSCSICQKGYWNNGNLTSRFGPCTQCPTNFTTTISEGASSINLCNLRECQPGSYYNSSTPDMCTLCPTGTFQDQTLQTSCTSCPIDHNTDGPGKSNADECRVFCTAGMEDSGNSTCQLCPSDSFKSTNSFSGCMPCTGNKTSGPSRKLCNETFCDVGTSLVGDLCTDCPTGSFKAERGNTPCTPCPGNMTTATAASTSSSDCSMLFCVPGYFSTDLAICLPCDPGTFKSVHGNDPCTSCPLNKTTPGMASTASSDCSINVCEKGYYRNSDNQCIACPIATFQELRGQESCNNCTSGYTTLAVASSNMSECRIVCAEGHYRDDATNTCKKCAQGSYQNMTGTIACFPCSGNFTTAANGSTQMTDCFIPCPVGYNRASRTECNICAEGFYQDVVNQLECKQCPQVNGFTSNTLSIGSSFETDCLPVCTQGFYQNRPARTCVSCPLGTYSDTVGMNQACQNCSLNATTLTIASQSAQDCNVALCQKGTFRPASEPQCSLCSIGTYQPLANVAAVACTPCPTGKTTLITGAESDTKCVEECAAGFEFVQSSGSCVACRVGMYRSGSLLACVFCPRGQTTLTVGSSSCIDTSAPQAPAVRQLLRFIIRFLLASCGNQGHLEVVLTGIVRAQMIRRSRSFNGLCTGQCTNMATAVTFSCGGKRRKRADAGSAEVAVEMNDVSSELASTDSTNLAFSPQAVIQGAFDDLRDVQTTLTENGITVDSITEPSLQCSAGSVVHDFLCAKCERGNFHNVTSDNCEVCPKDEYTDQAGLTACVSCPAGLQTRNVGSTQASDCIGPCRIHQSYCGPNGECRGDVCVCAQYYQGETCSDLSTEEREGGENITLIAGSVGGAGGLLLLVLLFVGVGVCMRKRSKKRYNGKKNPEMFSEFGPTAYMNPVIATDGAYLTDPTLYQADMVDFGPHGYDSRGSSINAIEYNNNFSNGNGNGHRGRRHR